MRQDDPSYPSSPNGVFSRLTHWLRRLRVLPDEDDERFVLRIFAHVFLTSILAIIVGTTILISDLGVLRISEQHLETLLNWKPADNSIIYDSEGHKLVEVFKNYHLFYPFGKIPKDFVNAITAIEDRSFWDHRGIDPKAMIRAAFVNLKGKRKIFRQGASTITQQLVRYFLLPREKTITRKISEIFLALELERKASKKNIFELYANSLFLGNGAYGIGAAAHRYFGKSLTALELHEMALIAGLFQSPSDYNPHRFPQKAKRRQTYVLKAMEQMGFINKDERLFWQHKKLNYIHYKSLYGRQAPYFTQFIEKEARDILLLKSIKDKGLRIYTTLSPQIQNLAEETFTESDAFFSSIEKRVIPKRGLPKRKSSPAIEAAMLVTDPRSGEILAMIGGRNFKQSQFNRATHARRQPGSSFKPIVYSLALARGFRWSDIFYVSPLTLGGNYRPRSNSGDYLTETTLLRSFYRSMNSPTLQIGEKLGIEAVINHAKKMGVTSPIKKEFGSMLGSSEVTLLEMSQVYGTFANQGRTQKPFGIKRITNSQGEVLYENEQTKESAPTLAKTINYLMVQGMRQVLIRGTAHKASKMGAFAAGKTGTSNNNVDNWFNGFTSNLLCIIWVGTDGNNPIKEPAGGGKIALPIWKNFMAKAIKVRKPSPFISPKGLISYRVHPKFGHVTPSGMTMWFVKNKGPSSQSSPLEVINGVGSIRDPFIETRKEF